MAYVSVPEELLQAQQLAIASFVESLDRETSANSEFTQSLIEQQSSFTLTSLQDQVEGLITKENENVSRLWALEERYSMNPWPLLKNSNASWRKLNLASQLCRYQRQSESKVKNFGRARPKTTYRVNNVAIKSIK